MAVLTNNAAVGASNGIGSTTYIFAVTIATITVADAAVLAQNTYNMTVVGINSITDTTCYMACQGANSDGSNGLENESGVALTATFTD